MTITADTARHAVAGEQIDRIDNALHLVREQLAQLPTTATSVHVQLTQSIVDSLLAGKELPAKIEQTIGRSLEAARANDAARTVYRDVLENLKGRRADAVGDANNAALRWLHDRLGELLDHVRALAPTLDGITSADTALRSGANTLTAWAGMVRLADEYSDICWAQRDLTAAARNGGSAHINKDLAIAGHHSEPRDPELLVFAGEATWIVDAFSNQQRCSVDPWPGYVDINACGPVPSTDPVAYLRWLAARGDAWVPDADQLGQALRRRQQRLQEFRNAVARGEVATPTTISGTTFRHR